MKLRKIRSIQRTFTIKIHPRDLHSLGAEGLVRSHLCFGMLRFSVRVVRDREHARNEVSVSSHILDKIGKIDFKGLELICIDGEFILGPYTGILLFKKFESITPRMLQVKNTYITRRLSTITKHNPIGLWGYLENYKQVGGVVFIFTLDRVYKDQSQIDGYYYNASEKKWCFARLPYPRTIYRKIGLSEAWKSHFSSRSTFPIFNDYYGDKWEVYQWLSGDETLAEYLPKTRILRSEDDLLEMMGDASNIYIKPIAGMGGFGVVKLTQEQGRYKLEYRHQNQNMTAQFDEIRDAYSELKRSVPQNNLLVQQSVDLIRNDQGLIDFRVLVQKDLSCRWVCQGIVIRQGVPDSIVSNISSDGIAWTMQELFVERLSYSSVEVRHLEARLYALALKICQKLDGCGLSLAYVGVDIGLDTSDRLWIIEVNMRDPDSTIALDVNDRDLYHQLKVNPLVYARGLQGFAARELDWSF